MKWIVFLFSSLIFLVHCQSKEPEEKVYAQTGDASFYARFFKGETTASGEIYDPGAMTAAHQTLPFGTVVEVTNLENEQSVQVTINDRGPFIGQRIIDLSRAAAEKLGIVEDGVVAVELRVIKPADGYSISDSVARKE